MKWYVLQVMSGKEKQIVEQLMSMGIHALAPIESRMIRTKGQWISKDYVIFSSYVFIECYFNADTWYKVSSVPSIIKWLGDKKEPSAITYMEAEWIRLLGNEGKPIEPSKVLVHEDGTFEVLNGILAMFKNNITKWHKRNNAVEIESPIQAIGNETIKLAVSFTNKNDTDECKTVDSSCDAEPVDTEN